MVASFSNSLLCYSWLMRVYWKPPVRTISCALFQSCLTYSTVSLNAVTDTWVSCELWEKNTRRGCGGKLFNFFAFFVHLKGQVWTCCFSINCTSVLWRNYNCRCQLHCDPAFIQGSLFVQTLLQISISYYY